MWLRLTAASSILIKTSQPEYIIFARFIMFTIIVICPSSPPPTSSVTSASSGTPTPSVTSTPLTEQHKCDRLCLIIICIAAVVLSLLMALVMTFFIARIAIFEKKSCCECCHKCANSACVRKFFCKKGTFAMDVMIDNLQF